MIMIAGVPALIACSGDEPQGTPSKEMLDVNPDKVIKADDISDTISVKANCRWTVELVKGWDDLVLSTHEGNGNEAIRLDMQKNTQTTTREGVLRVVSNTGVIVKTVNVKQRGIDAYVEVGKAVIEEGYEGGEQVVTIRSNAEWEIISDGVAGFHCDPLSGSGNGSVVFTIDPNLNEEARSSQFTIQTKDDGVSRPANATVTVNQKGHTLEISVSEKREVVASADGYTFDVSVGCSDNWRIEGGANGFSVNRTEGKGNGIVTVDVASNPYETERTATFTFRAWREGSQAQKDTLLQVRQLGKQVTLAAGLQTVTAQAIGGSYQIPVLCNAAWNAILSSDVWLHLTTEKGEGDGTVTFTCDPNTSTTTRSATVTIMAGSRNQYTAEVTVTQQPGEKPTVQQTIVSDVTKYTAIVSFSYQSNTSVVTEYGVCYATHETPTINDKKVSQSGDDTGNDVSFTLTNLESGTTYYARPYARNATGITYGEQKSFTTKGSIPGEDDNVDPQY